MKVDAVVNNSFGFGGHNATLIAPEIPRLIRRWSSGRLAVRPRLARSHLEDLIKVEDMSG